MAFKKDLLKNVLIFGGYNYISQGITFLSSTIISRILLPENYGLVGLITVFTGFIAVFSDAGLSYALMRSALGRTYHRILSNISFYLGLTLFFITALLAYPISKFYNNDKLFLPTIVLAFIFIIRSLGLTQGALLMKNMEFKYLGKITITNTITTSLLTIILAYLGAEHWSLIIPQLVVGLLLIWLYERKVKLGFKFYPLNYLLVGFKHTRTLMGSIIGFNIINYWSRNADNLIVGKWYGAADLGIYNRAYTLLLLPLNLITGLFSNVLFPSLTKLKAAGGDIEGEYFFVLRVITFLSYPIVFVLVLFPEQLVLLLWGSNWVKVASILPYFGLLVFTQTLLSTSGQIMVLSGKEKQFALSGWVTAFFLISGIVLGAFISIKAIAQYYSLFYIVFVLLFCMFYVYFYVLGFNKRKTTAFWLPKIILSLFIWCTITFELQYLKMIGLLILLGYLIYDSWSEILKAKIMISTYLKSKYEA